MRFKCQAELEKGRLDIAPLIDVIFLLLVFFMLTSSFISPQGIRVNLPAAVSSKALPREELVIFITDKDQLMANDERVSLKELNSRIETVAKNKSNILIKADKRASLGKVVEIWDLCRDAGIANVNIATTARQD